MKNLNLICVIENILTLALFVILAVVFNKWWIVLFSALFMSYVEKTDKKEE